DNLMSIGFVRGTDFVVQVFNNGLPLGVAKFAVDRRWTFTAAADQLQPGANNFVTAAVQIRDGASPQRMGRGEFSLPLQVTFDNKPPPVPVIGLDAASV